MFACLLQISDHVSVSLFSGTSAVLTFRCENETAQLLLSARSHLNQPKETVRLHCFHLDIEEAKIFLCNISSAFAALFEDSGNVYL